MDPSADGDASASGDATDDVPVSGGTTDAGASRDDGVVALVGFLLAAVATAGLLVALRQGSAAPAVWVGTGCGALALAIFFARRHALLGRSAAGPAIAASAVVAASAGYATLTGVVGTVAVPGLGWSLPAVFGSFLAGSGAVGIGLADYAGVSPGGLARRVASTVEMAALGLLGLIASDLAGILLAAPATLFFDLSDLHLVAISYVSFGVGVGVLVIAYLSVSGRDRSYIDVRTPTLRTVLWTIGGVILVFGVNVGVSLLMTAGGIDQSGHSTVEAVSENLDLLVVVVPAMFLIVGPAEELLYRNVVQKSLYDAFSRYGAVVVASAIFAAVHVGAYATAGAQQLLASLLAVFALSLALGTIYARTENLVVPAVVHGSYNALLFVIQFA